MEDQTRTAVEFRMLGSVEAMRDGVALPLGGPRQRHLLALLLLAYGRTTSSDQLIDELWSGEPPEGAETTLRSYVSRLRHALGGDVEIRGTAAGYAIDCSAESIDAFRFERLLRDGETALGKGAARASAALLREALSLWSGAPFAGVSAGGSLEIEARRLEELRLRAIEARIDADLALGAGAELVEELERQVATHRFRERLWGQLMLALYGAGRQADALAAYHRARRALAEELGIEPGDELRRLQQSILRQEVPRVVPADRRHNLPGQLTSFVGREVEICEIRQAIADHRLVTLTGIGGVGKTRLAVEVAALEVPDLPGGAFFVDLSTLSEPGLVDRHVARALDVRERAGSTAVGQIVERMRDAPLLLVLDNCEHVRDACADLARAVLGRAARVRILATSRASLGVPGEVDYPVTPLTPPPSGSSPADLRRNESVRLLMTRARAARPRLSDDDHLFETAAQICRDLDGLPLAIELAAARAKVLSLDEIASRLDDRFRFLVSWRRLTPARHQTLLQAMEWSHELLSPDSRTLFARLSVFSRGFTLDAVAATCMDGDRVAALDSLERLVDASLVGTDEQSGATRYTVLETVRHYAATHLDDASAAAMRSRHADYFAALAEAAEPQLTGPDQTDWFETLESEHDNIRAALAVLAQSGKPERLLRMSAALTRFWYVRGYLVEARLWLGRALEGTAGVAPHLRRRVLTAAAAIALLQGEYPDAVDLAESSLDVARETGEPRLVANGLSNLGAIVLASGDLVRAATLLEEAVVLGRTVADDRILALALNNLADHALTVGDYERAGPLFEESLALLRARDDTANVARSLFNLGCVALRRGQLDEARAYLHESLAHSQRAGDKEDLAWVMIGLAALAAELRDGEQAATLLGAAGSVLEAMGAAFKPFERQLNERAELQARLLLGDEMFESIRARGAALGGRQRSPSPPFRAEVISERCNGNATALGEGCRRWITKPCLRSPRWPNSTTVAMPS